MGMRRVHCIRVHIHFKFVLQYTVHKRNTCSRPSRGHALVLSPQSSSPHTHHSGRIRRCVLPEHHIKRIRLQ